MGSFLRPLLPICGALGHLSIMQLLSRYVQGLARWRAAVPAVDATPTTAGGPLAAWGFDVAGPPPSSPVPWTSPIPAPAPAQVQPASTEAAASDSGVAPPKPPPKKAGGKAKGSSRAPAAPAQASSGSPAAGPGSAEAMTKLRTRLGLLLSKSEEEAERQEAPQPQQAQSSSAAGRGRGANKAPAPASALLAAARSQSASAASTSGRLSARDLADKTALVALRSLQTSGQMGSVDDATFASIQRRTKVGDAARPVVALLLALGFEKREVGARSHCLILVLHVAVASAFPCWICMPACSWCCLASCLSPVLASICPLLLADR